MNKIQLSIVMAYYNRKKLLKNTLDSISRSSKCRDIEVIIVDDGSDEFHRIEDLVSEYKFTTKVIRIEKEDKNHVNPCIPYNIGFKNAQGDRILIQNPECFHVGDVIDYAIKNTDDSNYISFSTYALSKEQTDTFTINPIDLKSNPSKYGNMEGWYNHSKINPRPLHFASCLTKNNIDKLGGFNEEYSKGIGFDDDDLLLRIKANRLKVKICDSPFVLHQNHYDDSSFESKASHNQTLLVSNKEIYFNAIKKYYKPKIIGFSQLHNELELGNLKNWFRSMSFCDYIYIFDQGSTDGSLDYYKKFDNVSVIESKTNRFNEELLCKQELLDKLLKDHPDTDWIFWMDGDTLLDARLNRQNIEDILKTLYLENIESAWLGHYNLWRSDVWHRTDDQYDHFMKAGRMAFWKNTGLLKFDTQQGLHKSQHPLGISNGARLPFNLIHKGFADDNQILKKYSNYKSRGQSGWALDRLLDERTLKVERVPNEELPDWIISNNVNPNDLEKLINIYEKSINYRN